MRLPKLPEPAQQKVHTEVFLGYDHKLRIPANEFYDMSNLTADEYPLLASRKPRGIVTEVTDPGGLICKDALIVISGANVLVNGVTVQMGLSSERPKQLVSMGAYLIIFPDRKYLNTADLTDFGSIDASWEQQTGVTLTLSMCSVTGEEITPDAIQDIEPTPTGSGYRWIDTSGETHVLKVWSAESSMWTQVPTVYTKISGGTIGQSFADYDGVTISGLSVEGTGVIAKQVGALNGDKVIYKRGDGYIVVIGLLDEVVTVASGAAVTRSAPDMDYVCEAGNRLWGCKYGLVDGKPVNELYCSKLGDFKNWRCYLGLSTDSWAASVGSDGQWTAACNYLGYPTFFKEDRIHRIAISSVGAHQVEETVCSGVEKGSWRSPVVAGEILYYKGRSGIYAYDGSQPVMVSDKLGGVHYKNARAGAVMGKYYVSMMDADEEYHLFCYDTLKQIWTREDHTKALMFTAMDDDLFCIDEDTGDLISVGGSQGEREEGFPWFADSGVMHYEDSEKKYVGRYNFRIRLTPHTVVKFYVEYDSSGIWEYRGELRGTRLGTVTLPVIPRRCDHLRYRLEGWGEFELFSITRILEVGSDA